MSYREMMKQKKKPRFYEDHSKLLQQSMLEPTSISLYLHENMLNFYDSVEDIANCWEVYSALDAGRAKVEYQFGNILALQEVEQLSSLVESMAVTEYNMHGADHKDRERDGKKHIP